MFAKQQKDAKKRTQMHENKTHHVTVTFQKNWCTSPRAFLPRRFYRVAHRTVNKGAGLPWLDPWEDMHISQETMRDETLTIHWGMIMTWNNGYLLIVLKKKYVLPFLLQSVVKGCLIDPIHDKLGAGSVSLQDKSIYPPVIKHGNRKSPDGWCSQPS